MTDHSPVAALGAVVLAGGTGSRLGGVDKAALEVDGISLLERALSAVGAADQVVVVGEPVRTTRPVTWTLEEPRSGGPAAGLLAGLDALAGEPELVAVLAVDAARVTGATYRRLLDAVGTADAAMLVGAAGQRQTLVAVYRRSSLLAARPAERTAEHGLSVRRLVGRMRVVEVPAVGREAHDVDTWEDLRAVR